MYVMVITTYRGVEENTRTNIIIGWTTQSIYDQYLCNVLSIWGCIQYIEITKIMR